MKEWKVSFNKSYYKDVRRFNDKVTAVTLIGDMDVPPVPLTVLYRMIKSMNSPYVTLSILDSGAVQIRSKGRAFRSDKDKDNPKLAERIAESKAKMSMYKCVHSLAKRYIDYCSIMVTGMKGNINPYPHTKDSIFEVQQKYLNLLHKERNHSEDLLDQVEKA